MDEKTKSALKEASLILEKEVKDITQQLDQAKRILQQNPIALAARQGKLDLIRKLLSEEDKREGRHGNTKPGTRAANRKSAPDSATKGN